LISGSVFFEQRAEKEALPKLELAKLRHGSIFRNGDVEVSLERGVEER
jgi:hypothetical protein